MRQKINWVWDAASDLTVHCSGIKSIGINRILETIAKWNEWIRFKFYCIEFRLLFDCQKIGESFHHFIKTNCVFNKMRLIVFTLALVQRIFKSGFYRWALLNRSHLSKLLTDIILLWNWFTNVTLHNQFHNITINRMRTMQNAHKRTSNTNNTQPTQPPLHIKITLNLIKLNLVINSMFGILIKISCHIFAHFYMNMRMNFNLPHSKQC